MSATINTQHKVQGHFLGANHQACAFDFTYSSATPTQALVIFCHGFKGFKDWGGFNLVAAEFVAKGFCVFKFNFSHNGTSLASPTDFVQPELFAINTFNLEMQDLHAAENFIVSELHLQYPLIDLNRMYIVGHSKGGNSALLYCHHFSTKIRAIATWSSPSNFFRIFTPGFIEQWRKNKIQYVINARTKQQMPLGLSILDDYEQNADRYDLQKVVPEIKLPLLIVHGQDDQGVDVAHAHNLHALNPKSNLHLIPSTGHTFDMVHPYTENKLPQACLEAIDISVQHFKTNY